MKRSEIEQLLPGIFQRTLRPQTPLYALLEVMEGLHAPSEAVLANLDAFFDPYRTPDEFVSYLAGWVDLERLLTEAKGYAAPSAPPPPLPSGQGRLRELIAAAAFLSKWRGTPKGLLRFLETATGVQGFVIDEQVAGPDGQLRPFHLRIVAPQATEPYTVMLRRIIELEKPAYVTYELDFSPAP